MEAPIRLIHQNATGMTDFFCRSLASHCNSMRPAKSNWPANPRATQAMPQAEVIFKNLQVTGRSRLVSRYSLAKSVGSSLETSLPLLERTRKAGRPSGMVTRRTRSLAPGSGARISVPGACHTSSSTGTPRDCQGSMSSAWVNGPGSRITPQATTFRIQGLVAKTGSNKWDGFTLERLMWHEWERKANPAVLPLRFTGGLT